MSRSKAIAGAAPVAVFVSAVLVTFAVGWSIALPGVRAAEEKERLGAIQSFNYPKFYVRHRDGLGLITEIHSPRGCQDAAWYVCPGLAGNQTVSFRSANFPKAYLRHQQGRLKLHEFEDTDQFKADASFKRVKGLANKDRVSFESVNFPGAFIRHRQGPLWLEKKDGGDSFAQDATFRIVNVLRAAPFPVTGKKTQGVNLLDKVMLGCMDRIDCTAAALAVSRQGVVLHSRGYGWRDEAKTKPTTPDTMIGIASCEKPITAAMIRQLARAGRVDLNASIFKLLKIKPSGKIVDARVWSITVNHLLEHKAGWQGGPCDRAVEAAHKTGHKDPIPWRRCSGSSRRKS